MKRRSFISGICAAVASACGLTTETSFAIPSSEPIAKLDESTAFFSFDSTQLPAGFVSLEAWNITAKSAYEAAKQVWSHPYVADVAFIDTVVKEVSFNQWTVKAICDARRYQ